MGSTAGTVFESVDATSGAVTFTCVPPVFTEVAHTSGSDGNEWYVVHPRLFSYQASDHPTGTLTAKWNAECSLPTGGAVQDSGVKDSLLLDGSIVFQQGTYWGFDLGVPSAPATCTSVTVSYSGDSRYQGFTTSTSAF
jgi:hypothetical protein